MSILIVDNYDSFTYNLYQMVQALTDLSVRVVRNDEIDLAGVFDLAPSHIILSPGPGHPANPRDIGVGADVLNQVDALGCRLLGVCLGHQALGQHFGARVVSADHILHGKTSLVYALSSSPLFVGLPNPFQAMRYHSLAVALENFPPCLRPLATEHDHHTLMAMQHNEKPLYGVQFHPESIGTPVGKRLLSNFLYLT